MTLPLDEAQRAEAMERRAPVKVTRKNKGADVATRMDSLVFPETCTVCCGPTEYNVEATLQKSRLLGDPLAINVVIHACEAHRDKAHEALSLEQYNEKTTEAVIHCTNAAYAELLERCNA